LLRIKNTKIELYLSLNKSEKNAEENSIGNTFESLGEKYIQLLKIKLFIIRLNQEKGLLIKM